MCVCGGGGGGDWTYIYEYDNLKQYWLTAFEKEKEDRSTQACYDEHFLFRQDETMYPFLTLYIPIIVIIYV